METRKQSILDEQLLLSLTFFFGEQVDPALNSKQVEAKPKGKAKQLSTHNPLRVLRAASKEYVWMLDRLLAICCGFGLQAFQADCFNVSFAFVTARLNIYIFPLAWQIVPSAL